LWPEVRTKRSIQNKGYMSRACSIFRPDNKLNERYRWFAGEGKSWRQAVLVELGRIGVSYGDVTAIAMADKLVGQLESGDLSTTREAAAWLRRARLSAVGRPSKATVDALERLITTTILTYVTEHPDTTTAMVQKALWGAYSIAKELAEGEP